MGKLETKVARSIRRTKIHSAIIGVVAVAGVISLAAVAPNVLGVIGRSKYVRQRLFQTRSKIQRLIEAGYLVREMRRGTTYVRLTEKGQTFAALMHQGELAPRKPKRWDGKWRLLIFDVPERRRNIRNKIRSTLNTLGFVRLQDSVWVYPYDCEDFIVILKADFKIGKDVLYVIADHIEYDAPLRAYFKLPKDA